MSSNLSKKQHLYRNMKELKSDRRRNTSELEEETEV
jgi:hypothetical protein